MNPYSIQRRSQRQPASVSLTQGQTLAIRKEAGQLLLQAGGLPQEPEQLVALATELSPRVEAAAPEVAREIARLRYESGADALVIHGIPAQEGVAGLVQLATSVMLGVPFNYEEQLGGALRCGLSRSKGAPPTPTPPATNPQAQR